MLTLKLLDGVDRPPPFLEQKRIAEYIIKGLSAKLQFSSGSCGDGSFDYRELKQEEAEVKACIKVLKTMYAIT
jgi:hypothetical protein